MKLVIRSCRNEVIKIQLSSLLDLSYKNSACSDTNYSGVSLLTLKDTSITIEKSIQNIEALQVDKSKATMLKNPEEIKGATSFNYLKSVAPIEQYDHLCQLFYIQKNKVY